MISADVLVVEIADRALDQVAFLIDAGRRVRFERQFADRVPHAQQIFVVALDLDLGAVFARGADDEAHALGQFERLGGRFQTLAVVRIGDLAADAAAARRVGHQHAIAAGEREIGGERRALVAALFLDDLHQDDLAALDHFLDFVVALAHPALRRTLSLQRLGRCAVRTGSGSALASPASARGVFVVAGSTRRLSASASPAASRGMLARWPFDPSSVLGVRIAASSLFVARHDCRRSSS